MTFYYHKSACSHLDTYSQFIQVIFMSFNLIVTGSFVSDQLEFKTNWEYGKG